MSSIPSNSIIESVARRRARFRREQAANIVPTEECTNCKSTYWEQTMEDDWYCFICGNRGHWVDGVFVQYGGKRHGKA